MKWLSRRETRSTPRRSTRGTDGPVVDELVVDTGRDGPTRGRVASHERGPAPSSGRIGPDVGYAGSTARSPGCPGPVADTWARRRRGPVHSHDPGPINGDVEGPPDAHVVERRRGGVEVHGLLTRNHGFSWSKAESRVRNRFSSEGGIRSRASRRGPWPGPTVGAHARQRQRARACGRRSRPCIRGAGRGRRSRCMSDTVRFPAPLPAGDGAMSAVVGIKVAEHGEETQRSRRCCTTPSRTPAAKTVSSASAPSSVTGGFGCPGIGGRHTPGTVDANGELVLVGTSEGCSERQRASGPGGARGHGQAG